MSIINTNTRYYVLYSNGRFGVRHDHVYSYSQAVAQKKELEKDAYWNKKDIKVRIIRVTTVEEEIEEN